MVAVSPIVWILNLLLLILGLLLLLVSLLLLLSKLLLCQLLLLWQLLDSRLVGRQCWRVVVLGPRVGDDMYWLLLYLLREWLLPDSCLLLLLLLLLDGDRH